MRNRIGIPKRICQHCYKEDEEYVNITQCLKLLPTSFDNIGPLSDNILLNFFTRPWPMYKVVSLFSGCGGLDIGFKNLGFDMVYAADNDPESIEVYKRNVDQNAFVRDVKSEGFHADIKSIGSCDIVLGGFPCQGFSKAGPKRHDDNRNILYYEMKSAVATLNPEIFIAENVDGLKQNFGGKYVQSIVNDFSKIGYHVEVSILDAVAYGVPQHRRRIFFVGTKEGSKKTFYWPTPTHNSPIRNGEFSITATGSLFGEESSNADLLEKPRTIRETISDLLEISERVSDHKVIDNWPKKYDSIFSKIGRGQKLCNVRHAETSVYTWQIPEAFGMVSERQTLILETISRNRRHKKYGSIPNGNPLHLSTIEKLSGVKIERSDIEYLLQSGYLKEKNDGYDLKGAMFCSGLFKRPLWDKPSPTILTNFYNPRYFLHPQENRPFTLRECARLQTFDDNFIFSSKETKKELLAGYRLVGNSVPPLLSTRFAESVLNYLRKERIRAA